MSRASPLLRAALLLVAAVALGVGAALLAHRSGSPSAAGTRELPAAARPADALPAPAPRTQPADPGALRPGAAAGAGLDPLRYTPARRRAYERRAAQGLAHPLFAFTPGGAVATAARVAALRPKVERAARAGDIAPDSLEALVYLESAGVSDAQAGPDVRGAVGLTQIVAQTGRDLLGLRIDVERSARLTRGIRRGRRVAERTAERERIDERFDPDKALAAAVRYLRFARPLLGGRRDLALESYHMGVGNLQGVLERFGAGRGVPYAQLFFTASPLVKPRAAARLAGFGDDSSTYLWRLGAARAIMRRFRSDPEGLLAQAALQTRKNSAEEVLHPAASTERFADARAIETAVGSGALERLSAPDLASRGLRIDPRMGELAKQLRQPRARYRALRPGALRLLEYLATGVQAMSGARRPLVLTSTVRDERYQALLVRRNIQATREYSLHTTGWAFDIRRQYASGEQALAFQFLLDRLTALNLIAWVREPGAIHVTVSGDAERLLRSG